MSSIKKTKITFVGDIMCKKELLNTIKANDFSEVFTNFKKTFSNADYIVGNLETPIANINKYDPNKKFSFNTPVEFVCELKNVGFDLLSTANNHCLDQGINGLVDTINNLDNVPIKHIGTYKTELDSNTIFIEEINGLKLAFLSYTYGTNSFLNNIRLEKSNKFMINLFKKQEKVINDWNLFRRLRRKILRHSAAFFLSRNYLKKINNEINKAKDIHKVDYIFMCMHSGGQYNSKPDLYTKKLVKYLINNKADFIVGCHPHVVHNHVFTKNKKFAAYSLGNFLSTPYTNPAQKDDLPDYSIVLNFYFDSEKKLYDITFNIAKSIIDPTNKMSKVYLINDLINITKSKEEVNKILLDSKKIAETFLGYKINEFDYSKEFSIIKYKKEV